MRRSYLNAPEEVVEEIFSWLPPKSLIRFKCVCKSWNSLIDSLRDNPIFVAKHLRNSKLNIFSPTSLIFKLPNPNYLSPENFALLNVRRAAAAAEEFNFLREMTAATGKDFEVFDVYTCDGVVCVVDANRILLCNPAIGDFKLLPEPVVFSPGDEIAMAGFGYDHVSEDYKVVRIIVNVDDDDHRVVQIYGLGSDTWREINLGVEIDADSLPEAMEVHRKGFCYWLLEEEEDRRENLLSFDLRREEFGLVDLPARRRGKSGDSKLAEWNDSLALVVSSFRAIEIWVMMDGGDCSWIKHVTVGPVAGIQSGLLTLLTGEELLMQVDEKGREFLSYNVRTMARNDLSVPRLRGATCCCGIYVKTLIRVNKRERV